MQITDALLGGLAGGVCAAALSVLWQVLAG